MTDPLATNESTNAVYNAPAVAESEDCLNLNVYAPSSPPPRGGRAVLFWLYGAGDLQDGATGKPQHDGSAFAAYRDVIVVTIDYRTNGEFMSRDPTGVTKVLMYCAVFGFPQSLEIALAELNLVFLDQRLALEWVQQVGLMAAMV